MSLAFFVGTVPAGSGHRHTEIGAAHARASRRLACLRSAMLAGPAPGGGHCGRALRKEHFTLEGHELCRSMSGNAL